MFTFKLAQNQGDDHQQFALLKKKDPKALGYFYQLYAHALYVKIYDLVQDKGLAENLVHDVFVKLFSATHTLESATTIKGFLFSTARNAAMDHFRTLAIKKRYVENIHAMEDKDWQEVDDMKSDLLIILFEMTEQLTSARKKVIHLYLQDMKTADIAETLGIDEQTVRNHRTQAIKDLKKIIPPTLFLAFILLMCNQDPHF